MELIRIETPKLFTAIRETLSDGDSWQPYNTVCMQYCVDCDQVFLARFGYVSSGMGWPKWKGEAFHCPYCGKLHTTNYLEIKNNRAKRKSYRLPYSLSLRLDEFKNHLVLSVTADCIEFTEDGTEVNYNKMKETFRFDVKEQKVTFRQCGKDAIEIGNPYAAPEILRSSLLRFVNPESTMWQKQKSEVAKLLKKLRMAIGKKLKKQNGINLDAFFVQPGRRHGLLLIPLVNIAFRLACPDAANLKMTEGKAYETLNATVTKSQNMPCTDSDDRMNSVMILARKGLSTPQAIARAYGLPDTKGTRKLLTKVDVLQAGKVKAAFDMLEDYKYSLYASKFMLASPLWLSELEIDFITKVRQRLGAKTAIKMIIKQREIMISDVVSTYLKLMEADQESFWQAKLTAERMHDWLVERWHRQKESDYNLKVPEAIIRRLEMQKDTINFFVPTTAWQLRDAGKELHNCVGTYAENVLAGRKSVVLVADDKGKLRVCLEVTDGEVLQAKLVNNRPVSNDPVLNAEVLKWVKEAKLTIDTYDVSQTEDIKAEAV